MTSKPSPGLPLRDDADLTALWTELAPSIGVGRRSLSLVFLDAEDRALPMTFPMDDLPIFPDRALLRSLSLIINGLIADGTAAGVVMLLSRLGTSTITAQDKHWEAALREFSDWPLHLATRGGIQLLVGEDLRATG